MKIYRFKPKHQKNSLFIKVLIIVGILQAALLLTLGGIMVTQIILPDEQVFEAPPPPKENTEPKKQQQRQVRTKEMNKRSNQLVKRINVAQVKHVATPDVTINLPTGQGGADTGGFTGMGTMTNLANLKIDIPDMSIFGLPAKSDRVFIAFECSEETMRDDMGGFEAYNIVKGEIKKLVNSLPATSLFNIMTFDHHAKFVMNLCHESLVPATQLNKEKFSRWIDSINPSADKFGLKWNQNNYNLRFPSPPDAVSDPKFTFHYDNFQRDIVVNRFKVYQAAIEQGAGAVWILSLDFPDATKFFLPYNDDQKAKFNAQWEKAVTDAKRQGKVVGETKEWHEWIKSTESAREKAKKWLEQENANRRAKGVPQRVQSDMLALAGELKIPFPPKPLMKNDLRPQSEFKHYSRATLLASYEPILKKMYDERNLARPRVNLIILLNRKKEWSTKTNASVRAWARQNSDGSSRVLRAGKPVAEYEK